MASFVKGLRLDGSGLHAELAPVQATWIDQLLSFVLRSCDFLG